MVWSPSYDDFLDFCFLDFLLFGAFMGRSVSSSSSSPPPVKSSTGRFLLDPSSLSSLADLYTVTVIRSLSSSGMTCRECEEKMEIEKHYGDTQDTLTLTTV